MRVVAHALVALVCMLVALRPCSSIRYIRNAAGAAGQDNEASAAISWPAAPAASISGDILASHEPARHSHRRGILQAAASAGPLVPVFFSVSVQSSPALSSFGDARLAAIQSLLTNATLSGATLVTVTSKRIRTRAVVASGGFIAHCSDAAVASYKSRLAGSLGLLASDVTVLCVAQATGSSGTASAPRPPACSSLTAAVVLDTTVRLAPAANDTAVLARLSALPGSDTSLRGLCVPAPSATPAPVAALDVVLAMPDPTRLYAAAAAAALAAAAAAPPPPGALPAPSPSPSNASSAGAGASNGDAFLAAVKDALAADLALAVALGAGVSQSAVQLPTASLLLSLPPSPPPAPPHAPPSPPRPAPPSPAVVVVRDANTVGTFSNRAAWAIPVVIALVLAGVAILVLVAVTWWRRKKRRHVEFSALPHRNKAMQRGRSAHFEPHPDDDDEMLTSLAPGTATAAVVGPKPGDRSRAQTLAEPEAVAAVAAAAAPLLAARSFKRTTTNGARPGGGRIPAPWDAEPDADGGAAVTAAAAGAGGGENAKQAALRRLLEENKAAAAAVRGTSASGADPNGDASNKSRGSNDASAHARWPSLSAIPEARAAAATVSGAAALAASDGDDRGPASQSGGLLMRVLSRKGRSGRITAVDGVSGASAAAGDESASGQSSGATERSSARDMARSGAASGARSVDGGVAAWPQSHEHGSVASGGHRLKSSASARSLGVRVDSYASLVRDDTGQELVVFDRPRPPRRMRHGGSHSSKSGSASPSPAAASAASPAAARSTAASVSGAAPSAQASPLASMQKSPALHDLGPGSRLRNMLRPDGPRSAVGGHLHDAALDADDEEELPTRDSRAHSRSGEHSGSRSHPSSMGSAFVSAVPAALGYDVDGEVAVEAAPRSYGNLLAAAPSSRSMLRGSTNAHGGGGGGSGGSTPGSRADSAASMLISSPGRLATAGASRLGRAVGRRASVVIKQGKRQDVIATEVAAVAAAAAAGMGSSAERLPVRGASSSQQQHSDSSGGLSFVPHAAARRSKLARGSTALAGSPSSPRAVGVPVSPRKRMAASTSGALRSSERQSGGGWSTIPRSPRSSGAATASGAGSGGGGGGGLAAPTSRFAPESPRGAGAAPAGRSTYASMTGASPSGGGAVGAAEHAAGGGSDDGAAPLGRARWASGDGIHASVANSGGQQVSPPVRPSDKPRKPVRWAALASDEPTGGAGARADTSGARNGPHADGATAGEEPAGRSWRRSVTHLAQHQRLQGTSAPGFAISTAGNSSMHGGPSTSVDGSAGRSDAGEAPSRWRQLLQAETERAAANTATAAPAGGPPPAAKGRGWRSTFTNGLFGADD